MKETFNFEFPIQIRWSDLDPLGHVNNAVYVTYFEIARGRFMPAVCSGWDWHKDMFLIAHVQVSFLKELTLTTPHPVVKMRTKQLGTKSFVLEYQLCAQKDEGEVIFARGETTQVMFDMKSRTTIELPDWVRKDLAEFDHLPNDH